MRYAPRRKIKKAKHGIMVSNHFSAYIHFMLGKEDVLDVDDLSQPNETVKQRREVMKYCGVLAQFYVDDNSFETKGIVYIDNKPRRIISADEFMLMFRSTEEKRKKWRGARYALRKKKANK